VDGHRRATTTTIITIMTSTMMMMIMMELLTIKLGFVAVLNPYDLKISLAVFFARKNILCEVLRCYILYTLSVTDYASVEFPG
jgi:hypothetical protein